MSGRKAREPGPEGFKWRGLDFTPANGMPRVWITTAIVLGDRTASWRLEQPIEGGAWRARLRIGGDHFPGVGKTPPEALAAAAGEAANVATFIVAMLPGGELPGHEATAPRRSKRPRRTRKGA